MKKKTRQVHPNASPKTENYTLSFPDHIPVLVAPARTTKASAATYMTAILFIRQ